MTSQSSIVHELLEQCTQKSPHRRCFLLRVKPEYLAEYIDEHQRVWQEMRDALSEAGWTNYSLFLDADTGMIVGYYESEDVELAQRAIGITEVNRRWQQAMGRYFLEPDGGQPQVLSQYFYLP